MVEQSRAAFETTGAEAGRRLAAGRSSEAGAKSRRSPTGSPCRKKRAGRWSPASPPRSPSWTVSSPRSARAATSRARGSARRSGRCGRSPRTLQREMGDGEAASGALIGRAQEMGTALAAVTRQLREELPVALAGVEIQVERTGQAAQAAVPAVEAIQAAAAMAAESVAESEAGRRASARRSTRCSSRCAAASPKPKRSSLALRWGGQRDRAARPGNGAAADRSAGSSPRDGDPGRQPCPRGDRRGHSRQRRRARRGEP